MRIVAFSDTHSLHKKLEVPDGDVLVFAGDLMTCGYRVSEIADFGKWFSSLPHKKKVWIAGNHDRLLETKYHETFLDFFPGCDYLQDTELIYKGLKFYGSPVTPFFNNWAFNVQPGAAIQSYWDRISNDTDVLITHGPPYLYRDWSSTLADYEDQHLGSPELLARVQDVMPKIHIFGHIHGGYGDDCSAATHFYNVSVCDEAYRLRNPATVIDI